MFGSTDDPFEEQEREIPDDPFADVDIDPEERLEGKQEVTQTGSFRDFVRPGESEYLPVIGPVILTPRIQKLEGRGSETIGDKKVGWWDDGCLVDKHPYLLINPLLLSSPKFDQMDNFRETFGFGRGDALVFSDSGGLQISKMGYADLVLEEELHSFKENKIHPGRLVEWQAEYADIGAIIDVGTHMTEEERINMTYKDWEREIFEPGLEQTKESVRLAQNAADDTSEEFELMGVLHGKTRPDSDEPFESFRRWTEGITENGDFYGWAIGSSAGNIGNIALGMILINELRDPDILHGFGKASIDTRIMMEYIADHTDAFVTADSTMHANGSRYRQLIAPQAQGSLSLSTQEDGTKEQEDMELDRMPCRCTACHEIKKEEGISFLQEGETSRRGLAFQMHNLTKILEKHEMMLAVMSNYSYDEIFEGITIEGTGHDRYIEEIDIKFWDFTNQLLPEKRVIELYYTLKFSQIAIHDGLEEAFEQYVFGDTMTGDVELSVKPRDSKKALEGW